MLFLFISQSSTRKGNLLCRIRHYRRISFSNICHMQCSSLCLHFTFTPQHWVVCAFIYLPTLFPTSQIASHSIRKLRLHLSAHPNRLVNCLEFDDSNTLQCARCVNISKEWMQCREIKINPKAKMRRQPNHSSNNNKNNHNNNKHDKSRKKSAETEEKWDWNQFTIAVAVVCQMNRKKCLFYSYISSAKSLTLFGSLFAYERIELNLVKCAQIPCDNHLNGLNGFFRKRNPLLRLHARNEIRVSITQNNHKLDDLFANSLSWLCIL